MTYIHIGIHKTQALLAVVAVAAATLSAQTGKSINVTDSRPLSAALDALEIRDGISINYEDPPYQAMADVVDVSTEEQRAARPEFELLVPRIGTISADIPVRGSGAASAADVIFDVNSLLAAYRQKQLPGDFKVEQANNMIYVTPVKTLGADGSLISVKSPMTSLVDIPTAQRSVDETVTAILDSVAKTTGMHIAIGTFPFMSRQQVSFGAVNESARDALARLFTQVGWQKYSYRLPFDPKGDKMRTFDYMINIRPTGFVAPQAPEGLGPIMRPQRPAPAAAPQASQNNPFFGPAKQ